MVLETEAKPRFQSESDSETDKVVTCVYIEDDEIDVIILLASQKLCEIDCSSNSKTDKVARVYYEDDEIDDIILLLASQQFEEECGQLLKSESKESCDANTSVKSKDDFCQDTAKKVSTTNCL